MMNRWTILLGLFWAMLLCTTLANAQCPVDLKDYPPPPNKTCTYMLVLEDTAADGWEGAYLSVSINEAMPPTNYTIDPEQGNCVFIPLYLNDGDIVDFNYRNGANESEHLWEVRNAWGTIAADNMNVDLDFGPIPPAQQDFRLKAVCPEVACAEELALLRLDVSLGDYPEEISWEILDSDDNRVLFANANTYAGLSTGTIINYNLFLNPCEAYRFIAFDGFHDGWNGADFKLLAKDSPYGTPFPINDPLYPYNLVVDGPQIPFSNTDTIAFTLPCAPECAPIVSTAVTNCESSIDVPFITPIVCYPHCEHALGCTIEERYRILVQGDPDDTITGTAFTYDVENPVIPAVQSHTLPVGKHNLIYELAYCDGIIVRCTTDILIVSDLAPTMVCLGDKTIPLGTPDAVDDNNNNNLIDDLDECHLEINPNIFVNIQSDCPNAIYEYEVVLKDEAGNNLGNIVTPEHIGQTLMYHVTHCYSGHNCCGELFIQDKNAPYLECNDYTIPCTHPEALNAFYTQTALIDATGLPTNIAGGSNVALSIAELPFEVNCTATGELIKDVNLRLNIEHTDISDLRITLTPPASTGIPTLDLMNYNTCFSSINALTPNINITFDNQATTDIDLACSTDTPTLFGALAPTGVNAAAAIQLDAFTGLDWTTASGTWVVTIYDNDNNALSGPNTGIGQVIEANLQITHGFPNPYDNAVDCSPFEISLQTEMLMDNNCDLSDWIGQSIMRIWKATDIYGNSSTCTQMVHLKAPTMNDIVLPQNQSLYCDDVDSALPSETGAPQFDCFDIKNEHNAACDIVITYSDIASNGCSQNIIRTWLITNVCTGVSQQHIQTISLIDNQGPSIELNDASISTNVFLCEGDLYLNPIVTDNCSGVSQLTASWLNNGILNNQNISGTTFVEDLPVGETNITITAKDNCGNTTSEDFTITVIDDQAPNAACDDNIIVSLNGAGSARLYAEDLDEGSFDNCGIERLEIRRLDACLGLSDWDHYTYFDCCDAGEIVAVELRVTDHYGNTNICSSHVSIQDPIAPYITCPEDKTINCTTDYNNDLSTFGNAVAQDNCDAIAITENPTYNLDQCGAGTIIRTFTATANGKSSQCIQTISVDPISNYSVTFPEDVLISSCELTPNNTGEPTVIDGGCGMIMISHEDTPINIVPDACYKIKRTWTIMNWCIFDGNNPSNTNLGTLVSERTYQDDGDGFFQYEQYIKIQDNTPPVLVCEDITVNNSIDDCNALVTITANASDNCASDDFLEYSCQIDLYNDGNFDLSGNTAQVSQSFALGTHRIAWAVSDGCGNTAVCEQLVSVVDNYPPAPTCLNSINIEISQSGDATVFAHQLFQYAEDNCSDNTYLATSARIRRVGDPLPPTEHISVDCTDALNTIVVEIWVSDESGNSDYCTTHFMLQDNMNVCDNNSNRATIAGNIHTESMDNVEDVMVKIMDSSNAFPTGQNGNYGFDNLPMHGDYTIVPAKNQAYSNGISTYDLVLISQHILGIEALNNPYELIAADANNSQSISTFDIILLRQLVLYVTDEIPNNSSWRFVDASYVFPNPSNPWQSEFPEYIHYDDLSRDHLTSNFIAIKIGDINGSAAANNLMITEERTSNKALLLNIKDRTIKAEELIKIDFLAKDFEAILGYQFTLNFDQDALTFNDIEAGNLALTNDHLGLHLLDKGAITCSWNTTNTESTLADNSILFSLYFTAKKAAQLSNLLSINNRYTPAEAYTQKTTIVEHMSVKLTFEGNDTPALQNNEFHLYQNEPNPFHQTTIISFELPTASYTSLKIYSLSGQLIKLIEDDFPKGYHQIAIDKSELSSNGVYYYQLDTPTKSATRKMILVE